MIRFTVLGDAKPAGSKKAFPLWKGAKGSPNRQFVRSVIVDANPNSREWKNLVSDAARQVYSGPLLEGPLSVEFLFVLIRPMGHRGSKGLRPGAPAWPAVRPDALKLARGVEDAITGVIWRDDSQVVKEYMQKVYGEPARVEVTIRQLPATCAEAGLVTVAARPLPEASLFAEAR